jgi:hypothetical protein
VLNETRHMLSRIPLRWMLRQTFACNTGLLFHSDVLAEHGLDVETLWPVLLERKARQVGPAPSALDLYASNSLPSLEIRRDTFRRRSSGSPTTPPIDFDSDEDDSSASKEANAKVSGTTIDQLCILPEEDEDYFDALSPIHDQLKLTWIWKLTWLWWILEFIPIKYKKMSKKHDKWVHRLGPNRGRYRAVCHDTPNIHWTVLQRQKTLTYKIKARTESNVQWKVAV